MEKKMYVVDEEYAEHVKRCDRVYLEHESSEAVLREFRRLGMKTPRGKPYHLPMICRILRNEVYAAKKLHEGKLHDGRWKPIRTWETHPKVQAIMDANNRLKSEIEAEDCQVLSAQEQIRTLGLFKELIELNESHPERIRVMILLLPGPCIPGTQGGPPPASA